MLRPELVEGFVLAQRRDDHLGLELRAAPFPGSWTCRLAHSSDGFLSSTTAPLGGEHYRELRRLISLQPMLVSRTR